MVGMTHTWLATWTILCLVLVGVLGDGCSAHTCDSGGDVAGVCVDDPNVDDDITYMCDCSTGYADQAGTCLDHDACFDRFTEEVDGVTTELYLPVHLCNGIHEGSGECVDEPAPSLGFHCDCSVGFVAVDDVCVPEGDRDDSREGWEHMRKSSSDGTALVPCSEVVSVNGSATGSTESTGCDLAVDNSLCSLNADGMMTKCYCAPMYWAGDDNGTLCIECDSLCGSCSPYTGECWSCAYINELPMNASNGDISWTVTMTCQLAGLHPLAKYMMAGTVVFCVVILPIYCWWKNRMIEKEEIEKETRRMQRMETMMMRNATIKIEAKEQKKREARRKRREAREAKYMADQSKLKDKKKRQAKLRQYQDAFDVFDKDGSGTITKEELGIAMLSMQEYLDEDELEELFEEADTDESGLIEFPEFLELVMKRQAAQKAGAAIVGGGGRKKKKGGSYKVHPEPASRSSRRR